ncbi:transcriptional regulator, HxlR family [Actinomadura mexicana]|uniref:Transcriptional regulator, HxlR family n=1 Tax=Actinomadura mexicana TaxID=134959 RepID=A0A239G0V6_9ACTN|nr:transcriptional regulator, HxlR family [Actinomadura mexicana]
MSSSVLRQRLLELIDAGLVHQTPENLYALTELGRDAREALRPLSRWSDRWAAALDEGPADTAPPCASVLEASDCF